MLSFPEEIYLLALDEKTGKISEDAKEPVLGTVLIGAVLTELAFLKKIATDKDNLYILDTGPTKSEILNEIIDVFRESQKRQVALERALQVLAVHARRIEILVLAELLTKGILTEKDKKILWIFPDRSYPRKDDEEIISVEKRIRELILGESEASPKDAALISLLHASDLLGKILSPEELEKHAKRIGELSRSSDIGEKTSELVYKVRDYYSCSPFV
ncbi:MAG: GPP34 family phosphoprotein [Victivallales bacterium]|nr:GPP34 family phosphoprotein [Victivallales bacterium]